MDAINHLDAVASDSYPARRPISAQNQLLWAYVALLVLILIFFSRPGDWIPGLANIPLIKVMGILALLSLIFSIRQIRRQLPREVVFLAFLIAQLFLAAGMSPVWRGGAFLVVVDFTKILFIVVVIYSSVNTSKRLRKLIFTQAASVATITAATLWKGHVLDGRLEGTLGGSYSDPNDLALTIVISLPLCLALLFLARSWVLKTAWALAILLMTCAILLTGSRGGFFSFIVVVIVCLWEFAINGRRRYLLALTALLGVIIWQSSSGMLVGRLKGTFDSKEDAGAAYGSSQQRQALFWRSIDVTKEHPLFGVGPGNFVQVSGNWHVTHNSFTQMSSEGGVPAFILYVLILCSGFKNIRVAKRFAKGQREASLLAQAINASLVGYVAGSCFLSENYEFLPYILVAYTTALFLITKRSSDQSKDYELSVQMSLQTGFDCTANTFEPTTNSP